MAAGDATPPASGATPRGLDAGELARVVAEIGEQLIGAEVRDAARLNDRDDLLVYFAATDGGTGKRVLHVAPGGTRARVCTTKHRFARDQFATGPRTDRLRELLIGATLRTAMTPPGERCCTLAFDRGGDDRRELTLQVELFGPRGLWCLLDDGGVIVELSRLPQSAHRKIAPGVRYVPPATGRAPAAAPPQLSRFAPAPPSTCEQIDDLFTALDLEEEKEAEARATRGAIDRAGKRLRDRIAGLERQQVQIADAPRLRREADLILAYAFQSKRGDTELTVPDPDDPDGELRLALDPKIPATAHAKALYKRAAKLEKAVDLAAATLARAREELTELEDLATRAAAAAGEALAEIAQEVQRRGLGKRTQQRPAPEPRSRRAAALAAESYRRFTSIEGMAILVGRSNQQNDRLSIRTARGNDLWLHVGQGLAGSHVVVRLPRGKTASLETLLDAGTLAVHFSKARGRPRCEVIYTQAKHVRKPKGLPPGAVVPSHTKTLTVDLEEARLRRLLDAGGEAPQQ